MTRGCEWLKLVAATLLYVKTISSHPAMSPVGFQWWFMAIACVTAPFSGWSWWATFRFKFLHGTIYRELFCSVDGRLASWLPLVVSLSYFLHDVHYFRFLPISLFYISSFECDILWQTHVILNRNATLDLECCACGERKWRRMILSSFWIIMNQQQWN